MKKNNKVSLMISALFLLCLNVQATVHTITASGIQFSPSSSLTVAVGDTVKWMWLDGIHTTTSTSVPSGAASWDSPISSTTQTFIYPVTAAGTYNYQCNFHVALGMTGSFTATTPTGISPVVNNPSLILNSVLLSNELQLSYTLVKASPINIQMFDLTGKMADNFTSSFHAPGTYTEMYKIGNLSKGMYFLELQSKDMILTRKVVVD